MTTNGQDLIINRADLADARLVPALHPDPGPGEVLLRIDALALTANTVTYGVASESLGYWNFFPCDRPGFGRVPAWGFADVVASGDPGVAVGTRLYGFLPMSTHLMIEADRVGPRGLIDAAPHRQKMAPIYNAYQTCAADPAWSAEAEARIALFRPLFTTSFLLDDFHRRNAMFGARMLILSSASSKTALGLAALIAADKPEGLTLVGLTSARNRAFVEGLGLHDRVLGYDAVQTLPIAPAAYVDFAGTGDLLMAIHRHFGDLMRHTSQVGLTHWQEAALRVPGLPGPRPEFFFAPAYAADRLKDWGNAGFQTRLGTAWETFIGTTGWLRVVHASGPDAAREAWVAAHAGRIDPAEGVMISLQD
ncbi:MAG: DUF2855 family protein [Rhodobacteraceae bacterium]|nr:MAG: DUF2855 family protein [Paracoccaceae bacterium]